MIRKTIVLLLLAVSSMEDLRSMKIYMPPLYAALAMGVLLALLGDSELFLYRLAGVLSGAMLLLLAFFSREAIGLGDAALFLVLGIWLGLWESLLLLTGSLVLAALAGIFLWIRKKSMKQTFPFVPFVLIAYVLMLSVQCI
jgi:prepilin signal peptidase PulO-like enzyme (type II secretory pathway)